MRMKSRVQSGILGFVLTCWLFIPTVPHCLCPALLCEFSAERFDQASATEPAPHRTARKHVFKHTPFFVKRAEPILDLFELVRMEERWKDEHI